MKRNIILPLIVSLSISGVYAGGKNTKEPASPIAAIVKPSVNPFYIGVGAVASFIDRDPCICNPDGDNLKDERYGAVARLGYDYNQYIGAEARVLKTFGSDTFSEITHYGLYLKPQFHITNESNIYLLLGYGRTEVKYDTGKLSSDESDNGFSYGIGLEYDLSDDSISDNRYDREFDGQGDQEKGWGLWVDYQHLLSDSGSFHTDSDIITAGVTYDF
jgi:OOP family OmpA-OmpF porin